jgi:thyrotropin receptor
MLHFNQKNFSFIKCRKFSKREIKCVPVPDALNPCEDVMGSNWLRVSVWIVVALTVIGNVCVLVVLFSNRSELTVPKFLMCNLAFADFSMGLYLLLIASIDLHSMGEYFNFAFDWQYGEFEFYEFLMIDENQFLSKYFHDVQLTGLGCQTAGFLTVFAGHLSIFTLTIITVERWFAITNAIYLNKRLKLKNTIGIMIGGWIYSICMASLPLFGISNYSSTR